MDHEERIAKDREEWEGLLDDLPKMEEEIKAGKTQLERQVERDLDVGYGCMPKWARIEFKPRSLGISSMAIDELSKDNRNVVVKGAPWEGVTVFIPEWMPESLVMSKMGDPDKMPEGVEVVED